MKKNQGKLFLIPNVLAADTASQVISPQVRDVIKNTTHYLVEDLRTARRYISSLQLGITIEDLHLDVLNKKTSDTQIAELMAPVIHGRDMGAISEAGCPGIADPGALAVAFAHKKDIQVVPLPGPSSILLALTASGLNGQSFAFLGYIPIDKKARIGSIRDIESESRKRKRTQIIMETPFRNNHLMEDLKNTLHPFTRLCIASNITAADEFICTKTIAEWKKTTVDLHKVPTVFLIDAS